MGWINPDTDYDGWREQALLTPIGELVDMESLLDVWPDVVYADLLDADCIDCCDDGGHL